jgi:hypothetical protein
VNILLAFLISLEGGEAGEGMKDCIKYCIKDGV